MSLEDINKYLLDNQLLFFSLGTPLISAIAAWVAAWWSIRRAQMSEAERRRHEAVVQISEYRQAWINSLRESLAEFQSLGVTPEINPMRERDFYRLGTKIELLMNPKDEDYERLQDLMYSFLSSAEGDLAERFSINPEFVAVSQRILKREWERLKEELRNPRKFTGHP